MRNTINPSAISRGFLILSILVFGIFGYYFETGFPKIVMMLLGMLIGAVTYSLFRFLFEKIGGWIDKLPRAFNVAVLGILATLFAAKTMGF